ncbi:hypothetical protein LINPERHAP1_LOCUS8459 [Linum perenne]
MQFVYCLAGWPGSTHDSRILRDALARDNTFRIPPGNRPRSKEEMYNMCHSKARNVIECAFGMIVNACVLLHNYIRREGGPDVFDSAYTPEPCNNPTNTIDEVGISSVEASDEWTEFRNSLALSMWAGREAEPN